MAETHCNPTPGVPIPLGSDLGTFTNSHAHRTLPGGEKAWTTHATAACVQFADDSLRVDGIIWGANQPCRFTCDTHAVALYLHLWGSQIAIIVAVDGQPLQFRFLCSPTLLNWHFTHEPETGRLLLLFLRAAWLRSLAASVRPAT